MSQKQALKVNKPFSFHSTETNVKKIMFHLGQPKQMLKETETKNK